MLPTIMVNAAMTASMTVQSRTLVGVKDVNKNADKHVVAAWSTMAGEESRGGTWRCIVSVWKPEVEGNDGGFYGVASGYEYEREDEN